MLPEIDIIGGVKKLGENAEKEAHKGVENLGKVGHDAIEVVGNAGHDAIADAGKTVTDAAAAAGQVALAPTVLALATFDVIAGNPEGAKEKVDSLIQATADSVSAAAHIASEPYFFAANLAQRVDGDAGVFVRGALNEKLIEINIGPIILQKLAHANAQTGAEVVQAVSQAPLSVLLAAALQAAHDQFRPTAKEVPTKVKKLFRGLFPDEIIDNAGYVVASFGLTLPEVINGAQAFMGHHAFAVTVGDVVVFSVEPNSSDSATAWWAHELQHVVQYGRWGFDGFADKYVANGPEVESEAEAKSIEVMKALA